MHLLVGDTLDLGTGGAGREFRCRFSFTLQLASSVAAEAAGGGSSGCSGGGGGGGTKRRLEGTFANNSGDVHLSPKPTPEAIDIGDSSDDDGAGAGATVPPATAAPIPAPTVPKRRRRDRDGSSPFDPTGVVDLCEMDDLPVDAGKSSKQPLDLSVSDDEGDAGGAAAAAASGAPAAPTTTSSGGGGSSGGGSGGGSGGDCPSGGGVSNSSTSPKEPLGPERVPPPTRIDDDVSEPSATARPRSAPVAVDADLSMVEAAPPTTIENDQPEVPPSPPPSSPIRSLRLEPSSSSSSSSPPPLPRTPSPSVGEEEEEEEERKPVSSLSSVQRRVVAGGGGGGGTVGPVAEPPASPARPLTRMHDDLRNALKSFMRNSYDITFPVVDEFLARGTAPPSTLCGVIMTALLKSRYYRPPAVPRCWVFLLSPLL